MPVCSTYRIPHSTRRSSSHGLPALPGSRLCFGRGGGRCPDVGHGRQRLVQQRLTGRGELDGDPDDDVGSWWCVSLEVSDSFV